VFAESRRRGPDARFVYAADDAGFPYGRFAEGALARRVAVVLERLVERHAPDLVVVACNTRLHRRHRSAPPPGTLRGAHHRTVPPIKAAVALSRSGPRQHPGHPGTVARAYTQSLIDAQAATPRVTLVGSARLAELATGRARQRARGRCGRAGEIRPAFVSGRPEHGRGRPRPATPLPPAPGALRAPEPLAGRLGGPAPAVAPPRSCQLLADRRVPGHQADEVAGTAVFTSSGGARPGLRAALSARGLDRITAEFLPLTSA
jgi:glutamate racemase